jgi:transcriptional regulator with XRE-family HTH domain
MTNSIYQDQEVLDAEEIGENIRRFRKRKKLTQKDLSIQLNVDRTAITKLEKGERKLDAIEIFRLQKILGVTQEEILCLTA